MVLPAQQRSRSLGHARASSRDRSDSSDEESTWEATCRQKELEEHAAFRSLFSDKGGDELLSSFFKWILGRGWWHQFWAAFRGDGVMTWLDFEKFVHWEGKWTGNTRRAFKEMAKHCGTDGSHPHLTASGVLELKRWWQDSRDPGKASASVDKLRSIFEGQYGNLGRAWRIALDPDDKGSCCFLVFCRACNNLGMRSNLKSLWEELAHGNPLRCIFFRDWDPVGDRIVSRFAMGLAIKYGGMREGWNRTIKNANGHLHIGSFVECADKMGLNAQEARWLFAVLDNDQRRFLTEFDRLKFLSLWDPGCVPDFSLEDLVNTSHLSEKRKAAFKMKTILGSSAGKSHKVDEDQARGTKPFNLSKDNPFEFTLQLTKDEYDEYRRRLQANLLTTGQDDEAMTARLRKQKKKEKDTRTEEKVKEVLSVPVILRRFNNDDLLEDPDIAASCF